MRMLNMRIVMSALSLVMAVVACGKSSESSGKDEGKSSSTPSGKKLSLEDQALLLTKALPVDAKRKEASDKLKDFAWREIGGGFPESVLTAWGKLIRDVKKPVVAREVIGICEKIGVLNSHPCDDILKEFIILTRPAVGTKKYEILRNRDLACGTLSNGAAQKMAKMKMCQ